jgi:uncharacterized delta-60 repeat protein
VVLGLIFATGIAAFAFACGSDPSPECAEQACPDSGSETSNSADGGLDSTSTPDARDAAPDALDASDASDAESACPGPAGTLDPTFGDGGIVWLKYPGGAGRGVVVQPDGRTVVVGTTYAGAEQLSLVRLMPDGKLDPTFGTNGLVERQLGDTSSLLTAVALQPDGKIVAAGYARSAGNPFDFVVIRLLSDGTMDPTFGTEGVARAVFPGRDAYAASLQIDKSGRIWVGGHSSNSITPDSTGDFELARFNADGKVDTTFGTNGQARFDVHGTSESSGIVLLRTVGGALISGGSKKTTAIASRLDMSAVATLDNGAMDVGFADAGIFRTNEDAGSWTTRATALDLNGRIILAGLTGADFALVRVGSSGVLDTTFGGTGRVTTDFSARGDDAYAVFVQPDGKILAAGSSSSAVLDTNLALSRHLEDGGLDPSFGDAGLVLTAPPAGESYDVHGAWLSRCTVTVTGGWLYNVTPTSQKLAIGVARYRR